MDSFDDADALKPTSSGAVQVGGLALLAGALLFASYVVARSVITAAAGGDMSAFARDVMWVPANVAGAIGAALVLLGLPAVYASMARGLGRLGLAGVALIAIGWLILGVFVTLFGALVAPWLAETAPSLIVPSVALPDGLTIALVFGLVATLAGSILIAIPFLIGRVNPKWIGFMVPLSGIWSVGGDLAAPTGPASRLAINLLTNLGPILLVTALAALGLEAWLRPAATP